MDVESRCLRDLDYHRNQCIEQYEWGNHPRCSHGSTDYIAVAKLRIPTLQKLNGCLDLAMIILVAFLSDTQCLSTCVWNVCAHVAHGPTENFIANLQPHFDGTDF